MDIWKRDKLLQIICQNSKTLKTLELYFAITDTDVADRWISLIEKNNKVNNFLRFNYRRILNRDEIEEQFIEFNANINYINANYDIKLPDIVSVDFLKNNPEILNNLHEQYEVYGDRLEDLIQSGYFNRPKANPRYNPIWPGDVHNKQLHESFLRLNEQIHNFEAVYRTWDKKEKSICTCNIDYMPNKPVAEVVPEDYLHEPLKPEDYFLFTPEHQWGWIYLGYNTLGKHWSSACHDNDIEVVKRKQIRPQARFAAEMYLNFRPNSSYYTRISLYKWWLQNNFSEIIDPQMRLEDFALGFIPVAQLIKYSIDNKSFDARNIKDMDDWNLNVWSKFNTITSVKISNI
jgi:hypothetical protein